MRANRPAKIPSDDLDLLDISPFLKALDSPLNLQILFILTVYTDLTYEDLKKKLSPVNEKSLIESLKRMKDLGMVDDYELENTTHFKMTSVNYYPKTFSEYSQFNTEQLRAQLNEEFTYSYRLISLFKSVFGKLLHYIADFYITKLQDPNLDTQQTIQEIKYNSAIPRLGFVTKEEFEIYQQRFYEFEIGMIKELMERRKDLGIENNPNIEYLIANVFIPIKKVLERKS